MKYIYIAARWSRQPTLREMRDVLHEKTNWRVVSRWIDTVRPRDPGENFFISPEGRSRLAIDLEDLRQCDLVVVDLLEGIGRRGGVAIEIGYAIGLNKPIVLIGNPVEFGIFGNVFTATFPDWQTAFECYF